MRVTCPQCKCRHDIPNQKINAEADRLRAGRNGKPVGASAVDPSAPEVDGNVKPIDAINDSLRGKRGCKKVKRE